MEILWAEECEMRKKEGFYLSVRDWGKRGERKIYAKASIVDF